VSAWLADCDAPCQGQHVAKIAGGRYRLDELPLGTPLIVEAACPGTAPRRVTTVLYADTTLDFAGDPDRVTGAYLFDAPQVVAVEPAPEGLLDPVGVKRFEVRFSEAVDPASVSSASLALTSPDLPGMRITGGTTFFGGEASVEREGPDAAILALPGPLPSLARAGGIRLDLAFGKGTIRETKSGRMLADMAGPATVGGTAWEPGADRLTFRAAPDTTAPRLVSFQVVGLDPAGIRLAMTWSEPMAVMWAPGWPQGKAGRGVLDGSAYVGAVLGDLAFSPADPRVVTALATGSIGRTLVPRGVWDPAGNPATGSARVS
jgi:hypothetical protein